MTTPLTLTRPAMIHCLARLLGESGNASSNQSMSGFSAFRTSGSLGIGLTITQAGQGGTGGHLGAALLLALALAQVACGEITGLGLGLNSSFGSVRHGASSHRKPAGARAKCF